MRDEPFEIENIQKLKEKFRKDVENTFRKLEKTPYDFQSEVADKICEVICGGQSNIIFVKAPTGAGKTEAVLIPFLVLRRYRCISKLIWIVPNQSLLKHLEERFRRVVQTLGLNFKVVVDHSGLPFSMFWGDIIITTWDSFLYGYASQKHFGTKYTLPVGNIATSLLVFDEVQMYQELNSLFTPYLINLILSHIQILGVPTVVMSATVPQFLEQVIFGQVSVFQNFSPPQINYIPVQFKGQINRGSVAIRFVTNDLVQTLKGNNQIQSRYGTLSLFDIIRRVLQNNKKVLIVLNTVRRAVDVWDYLIQHANQLGINQNDILLLHSRFVSYQRENKEHNIPNAKIIVATQVVESGLDIDGVELGLFDICPPDSAIQRAGRVARRQHDRGEAIFFVPKNQNVQVITEPYASGDDNLGKFLAQYYQSQAQSITQVNLSYNQSVQSFIDAFYNQLKNQFTQFVKEDNQTRRWYEYLISAYTYFSEFRMFSHPPKYVEIRARLNSYIVLFLHPDFWGGIANLNNINISPNIIRSIKSKLTSLFEEIKEKLPKEIDKQKLVQAKREFSGDEQDAFREILNMFSVFVSRDIVPRIRDKLELVRIRVGDRPRKIGVKIWLSRKSDKLWDKTYLFAKALELPEGGGEFSEPREGEILILFKDYDINKGIF